MEQQSAFGKLRDCEISLYSCVLQEKMEICTLLLNSLPVFIVNGLFQFASWEN